MFNTLIMQLKKDHPSRVGIFFDSKTIIEPLHIVTSTLPDNFILKANKKKIKIINPSYYNDFSLKRIQDFHYLILIRYFVSKSFNIQINIGRYMRKKTIFIDYFFNEKDNYKIINNVINLSLVKRNNNWYLKEGNNEKIN